MSDFQLISEGLDGDRPILFFGAGQNAVTWIENLAEYDYLPTALIDETPSKQGSRISGVPIVSAESALRNWGVDCLILSTIFVPKISFQSLKKKIMDFGFKNVSSISKLLRFFPDLSFYYFIGEAPGTTFQQAKSKLLQRFVDPTSKEQAEAFFCAQIDLDPSSASSPRWQDYFLSDWIEVPDQAVYVDAGAYRGDTIQKFLDSHPFVTSEILAFEPDPQNYQALAAYVNALNSSDKELIQIKKAGVGRTNAKEKFHTLGNASSHSSESGNLEVDTISLDGIFDPSKSYFIKFDVEGSEMDALSGCKGIMRCGRSALAVSVYHRSTDCIDVSELLLDNFPDCQLFFRTLDENGMDSMLYAVPNSWVKKSN